MHFELFVPVYNEQYLLPYMIKHYQNCVGKDNIRFNIFDNGSNDDTVKIALQEGCHVGVYETGGQVRDDLLMLFKNSIWKNSIADFVIVIDCDEFIDIDPKQLQGHTIMKAEGWNMISDGSHNPQTVTEGSRHTPEDKVCVFNPQRIIDINYTPGAHGCHPIGTIDWAPVRKLYHMCALSEDQMVNKYRSSNNRLSELNKRNGWGNHYSQSEESVRTMHRNSLIGKIKVR